MSRQLLFVFGALRFLAACGTRAKVHLENSARLRGVDASDIAAKLTASARAHASVSDVLPCSSMNVTEVLSLRGALLPYLDYHQGGLIGENDGRQPVLPLAIKETHVPTNAASQAGLRDALCVETLKLWAHHVSRSTKGAAPGFKLPSMPNATTPTSLADRILNRSASCQTGHAELPSEFRAEPEWPVWPSEMTYEAYLYGVYPFWHLGNATGLPNIFDITSYIPGKSHVYYSATHNAARYDHLSCIGLPENLDPQFEETFPGFGRGPCSHLFLPEGQWLYSKEDGVCCRSDYPCKLTAVSPDFMLSQMNFLGVIDYASESRTYNGSAKLYASQNNEGFDVFFWYVTDMDGKPLEQGEGSCLMYGNATSRLCPTGRSIHDARAQIFHQYIPETVKVWAYNASLFDIPEICFGDDVYPCGLELPKALKGFDEKMCPNGPGLPDIFWHPENADKLETGSDS